MKDVLLDLQALGDDPAIQGRSYRSEREVIEQAAISCADADAAAQSASGPQRVIASFTRYNRGAALIACILTLGMGGAWWVMRNRTARDEHGSKTAPLRNTAPVQRDQTKLTFAPGLQTDVTWSPDGRFIAYASDQSGNFDIWVQPVSGGDPIRVTRSPAQERQPAWSPDGTSIVFRSERDTGGLYIVPAFGGAERQLAPFGVRPQWMADGAHVIFASTDLSGVVPKLYMVGSDGHQAQPIVQSFLDGLIAVRAWRLHPDGRRVSVLATARTKEDGLFAVPLSGGSPVLSKNSTEQRHLLTGGFRGFDWSPLGTALYVERLERAKTDLWRFIVNPDTLEQVSADRLTTGGGVHKGPALSPNGKHLAFTTETQTVRLWSFPLEAGGTRVGSAGKPLTDATAQALTFDLTRDGRKLTYGLARQGVDREETWVMDLVTGGKQLVSVDRVQGWQQWSPNGTRLAYPVFRWSNNKPQTQGETAIMIRAIDGGGEQAVTTLTPFRGSSAWSLSRSSYITPWDWSTNGQGLIVGSDRFTSAQSLCLLPLNAAPHGDKALKLLASDPKYGLYQANVSPNGRWIAFMAHNLEESGTGTIAVIPSTGADSSHWTHVTDAREWADKPRWSLHGNLLYFTRRQGSFFNVWALRFDPQTGKAIGAPFQLPTSIVRASSSRPDSRTATCRFHPRGSLSRLWRPAGTSGCLITWTADDLNNVRWVSHCRDLVQLPVAA